MKFSFHYYFSIFIESKIKIILFEIIKINFYLKYKIKIILFEIIKIKFLLYFIIKKSIKSCLY